MAEPAKDFETLDVNMDYEEEEAKQDIQSSSSSDSDSDEDAAADEQQLQTLEKELAENPSNYDAHAQYIKSLRKFGDIEKMRKAREDMNALFPLTPSMWSEWAKDEASLTTGSEAYDATVKLYERGVNEYLSVSLWCDYLKYVEEHDPAVQDFSPEGLSKMRNLYERALTAAGLHVTEGKKIWEAYKELENNLISTHHEENAERQEEQERRIRSLYQRQLSIPHADSESTLVAYTNWESLQQQQKTSNSAELEAIPSVVASAYKKAMEIYKARVYHEEQISKQDMSETERLKNYMTYLKFEQSSGDPSRVQILYERAVTDFPLSNDLWLDYTCYLEQTLKVPKIVIGAYSRATRNCPWIGKLWVQYLLSLERSHALELELATVYEQSLLCSFSSFEEYLELFLTRIDGLRRRFSLSGSAEDSLGFSVIRDTFQRAADYLSPNLKNTNGLLHMYAYWARLEWELGKDLVAARGVWESLLKISGSMLESWEGYVKMEIETGHIDAARSIYKRCYSKRFMGTGSEDICHSWLRFEREFGTLDDYDHAVKKVTPRLEELQLYKQQQEARLVAESVPRGDDNPAKKPSQKRKTGIRQTDGQPTPKRQKGAAENPVQATGTETEKAVVSTDSQNTLDQQTKSSSNKELYKDQCTAFLSNLHLQVKDEHLHSFFDDVGGVSAIRVLKDKYTGKSRGLAYVDFTNAEYLSKAVAKNKKLLLGKKVSIVRSNPQRNKNKESSEKNTREPGDNKTRTAATESTGTLEDPKISTEHSKESDAPLAASAAAVDSKQGDRRELKGKNTFAVPRNLARPLGWTKPVTKKEEENDEVPKSNDEFRKMLLKK
ncbi:squamous cell carcinoma antigen recognized by T-cells 3-like [Papaver somniferum]|uniref:squamous cell carcinoma antigen recognized by T-cells 3-like n=1 Tax=Papaver somniferum TaxID=3469 RepID=UPI000E6F8353|nr:squamous cell carcinoma antigen recognized by T-cells 3-like [Papaver somniferum]